MTTGDDIELTISITDPDGTVVDLNGCIFSIAIEGVHTVSYYLSSNQIVLPSSLTAAWNAGVYPIQYRLTLIDGTEVFDNISSVVIKESLIKGDLIEESSSFPYSFPISF